MSTSYNSPLCNYLYKDQSNDDLFNQQLYIANTKNISAYEMSLETDEIKIIDFEEIRNTLFKDRKIIWKYYIKYTYTNNYLRYEEDKTESGDTKLYFETIAVYVDSYANIYIPYAEIYLIFSYNNQHNFTPYGDIIETVDGNNYFWDIEMILEISSITTYFKLLASLDTETDIRDELFHQLNLIKYVLLN